MSNAAHASPAAPLRLLDLPPEVTAAIAGHVPEDGVLMLACTSKQCREAAKTAHRGKLRTTIRSVCASVQLFRWSRKGPNPALGNMLKGAMAEGNLNVVCFLHGRGICSSFFKEACWYAAYYGHIDCLRYARVNGCYWDEDTCFKAAEGGHLDCLRYAHENGCDWDEDTCSHAARGGHLDCLRYAHENGCDWDSHTCDMAAKSGHLDCLRYAHENGGPWDEDTCANAAKKNGHHDVRAWIRAQPD